MRVLRLRRVAALIAALLGFSWAVVVAEYALSDFALVASGASVAVVLGVPRRDAAGAAAISTAPGPRGPTGLPGLVPLAPGVADRLPVLAVRQRRPRTPTRVPRGAVRAMGAVAVAFAAVLAVMPERLEQDCWGFGMSCSWRLEVTGDLVAVLTLLAVSVVYAAHATRRGHRSRRLPRRF